MAFREVAVAEIREALRAWLGGAGLRKVAERAGVDRKTARRYVDAAVSAGLARDGGESQLTDELLGEVAGVVRPVRPGGHGSAWDALEACHAQVKAWVDDGLTVVKIGVLLERQGVRVPYRTLHRFCAERCGFGRKAPTVRVADGEPGGECQLDFGYMGMLADPVTGRRRKVHALIFTAAYSRHMFVWLTFSQTLSALVAGCEASWTFFGGVFKVIIPDNMAPVVADADAVNPRFTAGWLDYAQHCGFATDAARVRSPRDKPRVAYCTSSERFVARWCSCRSDGVVPASLVAGWRVGSGRVVEDLAFVVIPLPADNSGVVPDLDGAWGHAEQFGYLVQRDQPGVEQPLAAAA
jgi:transposase